MSRAAVVRLLRAAAGILLAAALLAAPARAEEQPAILKAYGLDWIERIKDEAWPQPDKTQRPIICLLDTGVAVTPDTPADNPAGPIVARLDLDGHGGTPQGNTFQHLHGTQMASVIAAPRNNYGTVGVFPQARIVSVRVTEGDATYISPGDMRDGARRCQDWSTTSKVRLAAVVMAESNYDQRESDGQLWDYAARRVEAVGGLFVAAVGNSPGASAVAPVSLPNIVSIAAGDEAGAACPFNRFSSAVALLGPGCRSSGSLGWPAGSSTATAAVGALVAALATREPNISVDSLRARLGAAVVPNPSGSRVSAASLLALFPNLVAPLAAPVSTDSGLVVSTDSGDETNQVVRLWRPRVRLSWKRGWLRAVRLDHHAKGTLVIGVAKRKRLVIGVRRSARVRVNVRPKGVSAWVEGKSGRWRSLSVHAIVHHA